MDKLKARAERDLQQIVDKGLENKSEKTKEHCEKLREVIEECQRKSEAFANYEQNLIPRTIKMVETKREKLPAQFCSMTKTALEITLGMDACFTACYETFDGTESEVNQLIQ